MVRQKRDADGGLGRAIRVARTQQGLNRKELAQLSGLSYPYVSEIESGRKTPSSRALGHIAGALDVAPHELMEAGEAMSHPPDTSWFSPRHAFFLRPAQEALSGIDHASEGAHRAGPEGGLVDELRAEARRLSRADVALLVDLARRLGRIRPGP